MSAWVERSTWYNEIQHSVTAAGQNRTVRVVCSVYTVVDRVHGRKHALEQ